MKKTLIVLMVLLSAMLIVSCNNNPEQKKTVKVGDVIELGTYPADAGEAYAGKPITWKVLEIDGSKALVISEKILTKKDNGSVSIYKWSTSPIRAWLNNTGDKGFISQYGLASASIVEVSNTTEAGKNVSTQPEETTKDKVFLLSKTEFDRYGAGSAYSLDGSDDVYWWLRSPCNYNAESDCYSAYPGDAGGYTNQSTSSANGVRPAFWINL